MQTTKIGYRYYPDTDHYTQQDLETWLPVLRSLGAEILVLTGSKKRAVPETFITGLIQSGIRPVIHIPAGYSSLALLELEPLFTAYKNWGVTEVIVGSCANQRGSWTAPDWSRSNLIERFIDRFLPILEAEYRHGLTPLLPPLEPGGDYWDTAFLEDALNALQRRAHPDILQALNLAIKVFTYNKPLNWGMGGSSAWPNNTPYSTSEGSQDQIGFRITDWYAEISLSVLGHSCPMIASSGGASLCNHPTSEALNLYADQNAAIFSLLKNNGDKNLSAFAFDHLVSTVRSEAHARAWFDQTSEERPVVAAVRSLASSRPTSNAHEGKNPSLIDHIVFLPEESIEIREELLRSAAPFLAITKPVIIFDISSIGPFRRATVLTDEPLSQRQREALSRADRDIAFFDRTTIPALNAAANASQSGA